jgi:hypothetical protein
MNDKEIQNLVDTAVELHREIATKTEQLKQLKAELIQQARLEPQAHAVTETGGKRWTVKGSDGCIARVSFPAPSLISEIEAASELVPQLQGIAGNSFRKLFTTVKSYQLVENFRTEVASLLPSKKAEAVLSLCESESAPRVSFEAANHRAEGATSRK